MQVADASLVSNGRASPFRKTQILAQGHVSGKPACWCLSQRRFAAGAVVLMTSVAVFAFSSSGQFTPVPDTALTDVSSPLPATYVATHRVLTTYPHEPTAFTQGLAFDASGNLYESDGLYRESMMREVDINTGLSRREVRNPDGVFAEGATVISSDGVEKLLQLTWKARLIFEYALPSLVPSGSPLRVSIGLEGWGSQTMALTSS